MTNPENQYRKYDLSLDLASSTTDTSDLAETVEIESQHEYIDSGSHAAPLTLTWPEYDPTSAQAVEDFTSYIMGLVDVVASERELKPIVVEFLKRSISSRITMSTALDSSFYQHRLDSAPNLDRMPDYSIDSILKACDDAKHGFGTVSSNRIAQITYGIRSMTLGGVTIVGDYRKESESNLWRETSELIGREVKFSEGVTRTEIAGFDRPPEDATQHIGAIRVVTKRTIQDGGEYDSTIKNRQIVILDTSPTSDFPKKLAALIREAYLHNDRVKDIVEIENPRDAPYLIEEFPLFQEYMEELRSESMRHSVVLARSEAIYSESKVFAQEVRRRRLGGGTLRQ